VQYTVYYFTDVYVSAVVLRRFQYAVVVQLNRLKIRSEIWVVPSEIWRPKNIKFRRDFAQLRDLIANIYRTQQLVNRKKALQTTDTPVQALPRFLVFYCTLPPHLRDTVSHTVGSGGH